MPYQVHQIGRVLTVVNSKGAAQSDLFGVVAQQSRRDTVKGSRPQERAGRICYCRGEDALHTLRHLGSRAPRKGHEQYSARISTVNDQMGDAVGDGVRLARSSAGDDEQRTRGIASRDHAMLSSTPLLRV